MWWLQSKWRAFKQFGRWVVSCFQWAWFLRDDNDYDYGHILMVMQYKLSRIRKHIIAHDIIAEAAEVGTEIKHAEDLIERLVADDYCADELEAHHKQYGYCWKSQHSISEVEALRAIHDKANALREKDWAELWAHLNKNLRRWWC
jgi:hypothetical protein